MVSLGYILSPKISDRAILTGSATASGGGIANLQNHASPRTVFTSGSCFIEGDLGASYTLDTLAIGFINSISSLDTFQLRLKNTYPVTSDPVLDLIDTIWPSGSDQSSFAQVHRQEEFTSQTVRYFRVDFNCSQNVHLRRLFIGSRIEPSQGVAAWSPDLKESFHTIESLGGSVSKRQQGGPRRTVRLEWPALEKTTALGPIYDVLLERGATKDYMVALTHGDSETLKPMAYVYIGSGSFKINHLRGLGLFSAEINLEELAPLAMR